jgi:hypothetical protein
LLLAHRRLKRSQLVATAEGNIMAALRWYIARNKVRVGPFSAWDLRQLAGYGLLRPGEFLLAEGAAKWVEAASVPGLFPAAGQKKYWLAVAGQRRGPFFPDQIRAGLTTRQFTFETMACAEGAKQWLPLGQIDEFKNFVPAPVSPSRAQLLTGSLELEEAEIHLAGKSGDALARLISTLMDLKRNYAHNPTLVESLEATIQALQNRREEALASSPSGPVS